MSAFVLRQPISNEYLFFARLQWFWRALESFTAKEKEEFLVSNELLAFALQIDNGAS